MQRKNVNQAGDIVSIICNIANGNQLATDFSNFELREIVNCSAASKFVVDECKEALKLRKR